MNQKFAHILLAPDHSNLPFVLLITNEPELDYDKVVERRPVQSKAEGKRIAAAKDATVVYAASGE
jgi:hypothetical protein